MDETFEWLKNYKMEDFYILREERSKAGFLRDAEKQFIKATSVIPPYEPWDRLNTGICAFKKVYAYIKSKEGKGSNQELHDMLTTISAVSTLISTSISILTAHCPKAWDTSFLNDVLIDRIRERFFFSNPPNYTNWDKSSYILGVIESLQDAVTELEKRIVTKDIVAVYKITSFEECFMCCTADLRYAIARV